MKVYMLIFGKIWAFCSNFYNPQETPKMKKSIPRVNGGCDGVLPPYRPSTIIYCIKTLNHKKINKKYQLNKNLPKISGQILPMCPKKFSTGLGRSGQILPKLQHIFQISPNFPPLFAKFLGRFWEAFGKIFQHFARFFQVLTCIPSTMLQ